MKQTKSKDVVKNEAESTDSVDDDVQNIISSASESPGDVFLSKNQMEILELEMRARAIKSMLKMHVKEEPEDQ